MTGKNRLSALQNLKAAREGKVSRIKEFAVSKNDKIYDEVDEKEYNSIVRKRLDDDFVVDDDGLGYADYGVDDWDAQDDQYSSDEEVSSNKRVKKEKKKNESISALLQKQQMKIIGAKSKENIVEDSSQNDDLLADLLGEVDEASKQVSQKRKQQKQSQIKYQVQSQYKKPKLYTAPEQLNQESQLQDLHYENQDYDSNVFNDSVMQVDEQNQSNQPKEDASPNDQIVPDHLQEEEEENELAIKVVEVVKKDKSKILKPVIAQNKPKAEDLTKDQNCFLSYNANQNQSQSKSLIEQSQTPILTNNALGSEFKDRFLEPSESLFMFWTDAYEGQNGKVYLFGKVLDKKLNKFISCCLTVNDIERQVFLLPRTNLLDQSGKETDAPVTLENVWTEVDQLFTKKKIGKWSMNSQQKKYAFEVANIPVDAEWVEINYGFNYPQLNREMTGKSFSNVFGTNTSALEILLMRCKIMGPCFIEIKDVQHSNLNISWCGLEIQTSFQTLNSERLENKDLLNIRPVQDSDIDKGIAPEFCKESPPLTVLSLGIKTVMNYEKNTNEIVMISLLVYRNVSIDSQTDLKNQNNFEAISLVNQLGNQGFPLGFQDQISKQRVNIQTAKGERALLNLFMALIQRIDPDMYVGHNLTGFSMDILQNALKSFNTQGWSKLGRLRRNVWPKSGFSQGGDMSKTIKELISGRLLCDTFWLGKQYIKSNSYSLTTLAKNVLSLDRPDIDFDMIPNFYQSTNDLIWLIKHSENDCFLSMKLVFQIMLIPLTKQLTNLAGNLWQKTLTTGRSDCNEHLLCHEFINRGYIVPDKYWNSEQSVKIKGKDIKVSQADDVYDLDDAAENNEGGGRKKPQYLGGLVLEPKKGLYDKFVLLLDFNSLYPSIIQEYNICFTTVERQLMGMGEYDLPDLPDPSLDQGILPSILSTLVNRRRQVKSLMKNVDPNSSEYTQLNIRQQALKLTANSMYGCLGYTKSRFYAQPLAKLITARGREILQDTVKLAEETLDLDVIYGDTDSIMVNTRSNSLVEVKQVGKKLKTAVNAKYKLLEIEMDGFFRRMLILKKKKYAALTATETADGNLVLKREVKGLDIVRRDWCDLSHDASDYVLNQILSDLDKDEVVYNIHSFLEDLGQKIKSNQIPVEKFVINKALTKAPEDYNDSKSQPHVQVALRMKSKGIKFRSGETVPYVICLDSDTSKSYAQRAYHPDEILKSEGQLTVDYDWYLNVQVHPPISRLCQPIEGTDDSVLARYLGLDPSKFKKIQVENDSGSYERFSQSLDDVERFKDLDSVRIQCTSCNTVNEIRQTFFLKGNDQKPCMYCQHCDQLLNVGYVMNQLTSLIRQKIKTYGKSQLICDEPSCNFKTKQVSVSFKCIVKNCAGTLRPEVTPDYLYHQIYFWSTIFDCERYLRKVKKTEKDAFHSKLLLTSNSFNIIHKKIKQYLDLNTQNVVSMKNLFNLQDSMEQVKIR